MVVAAVVGILMPSSAEAYIGPGAGVTAIGTVVAFVSAILFAIVGFVWYPIKRLLRAVRRKRDIAKAETSSV
jgi:hypothetical protein